MVNFTQINIWKSSTNPRSELHCGKKKFMNLFRIRWIPDYPYRLAPWTTAHVVRHHSASVSAQCEKSLSLPPKDIIPPRPGNPPANVLARPDCHESPGNTGPGPQGGPIALKNSWVRKGDSTVNSSCKTAAVAWVAVVSYWVTRDQHQ